MTVTVTRIPHPPLQRRPSSYEFEVTGNREEVEAYLAERQAAPFDGYDTMFGDPVEQPDGTWRSLCSRSYSCD